MTWHVDLTERFLSDRIGLQADLSEAITDTIVSWIETGPPRQNPRDVAGITVYQEPVAGALLLGYMIDDARQRFLVLWLTRGPSGESRGGGGA